MQGVDEVDCHLVGAAYIEPWQYDQRRRQDALRGTWCARLLGCRGMDQGISTLAKPSPAT